MTLFKNFLTNTTNIETTTITKKNQSINSITQTNEHQNSKPFQVLEQIENYMAVRGHDGAFMLGDQMTKADCYLLPILQHVRVAGKVCWGGWCCEVF